MTGLSWWVTMPAGVIACYGLARYDSRLPLVRYFLALWVGLTLFVLPIRNLLDVLCFGHGMFAPWPMSVRLATRPYLKWGGAGVLMATFVWSVAATFVSDHQRHDRESTAENEA